MPAALPGMCVSRWTLLDVASGGSAGRSADAGAANARANAAASHLMALPPTTGLYTQPLSISTLPVRLIGDHPRKGGTHHEVPAADSPGHDADAARPRGLGSAPRGRAQRGLLRLQGDQRDAGRHAG